MKCNIIFQAYRMNRLTGKNIYIIGFMATGKSRIGRELARLLHWPFLDTDQLVEQAAGLAINDIFSLQGETVFRDLESSVIAEIARTHRQVISLGGGAIMRPENWHAVSHSGLMICLTADLQTIMRRVQRRNERPLLQGHSGEALAERIQSLLSARMPIYEKADYFFESREEVSARDLALKIYRRLLEAP